MDFGDIFRFISPEERKQKTLDYERKVFPLGLAQKDAALNAIRPLINPKIADTDLMYTFIMSKQKYIESLEQPEQSAKKYLQDHKLFSDAEKKYIFALVLLDAKAETLEGYPTIDDIKLKAV